jgi:uncharacterized protein (TIGR03382 family)
LNLQPCRAYPRRPSWSTGKRALQLLSLAGTLGLAGVASAAQVWTAPAATKVRPLTPVPAGAPAAAAIAAAQNEFEAFQVVVTGPASGVSMSLEGLSDGAGHIISGRDVVIYREALIRVVNQSGGDGASGWWPDALVPDIDPIAGEKRNAFPFDVPAGENRVVFVDVHVPEDAAPGNYSGTLLVNGSVTTQVPVTLTVWDFSLPSTATLRSAFGITWNGPCMGHGDGSCSNLSYEKQLRSRYVQAALDNRVSVTVPDASVPVSSNGTADWSTYDTYAGPFFDGTAPTRLKGARLTAAQIYGPGSAAAVKGWSDHFKAKGWYSTLFNYICDEPPLTCAWTDIPGRIASSRAGDSQLTTLLTSQPYEAAAHGVSGIDLYVAVINFMEDRPGTSLAGSQRARWPSNIWLYQGCMSFGCAGVGPGVDAVATSGWPSYAIDTDATRNRALEWMSFIFDATGELYYEMTQSYFGGDPWVSQVAFGGNGDGTLFYPGTAAKIGGQTEIPVESLRLKGIRDGMEDYELLAMAAQLGLGAQAKQIALAVYPNAYQGVTTPEALAWARARLAGIILAALGKNQPPPGAGNEIAPPPPGDVTRQPAAAGIGFPSGGCSSGGPQSVWLALPLLGVLGLQRRRRSRRG